MQHKILLLCFKCLYGNAPSYLCDLLVPYNNFRSCLENLLHVPKSDRDFALHLLCAWKQLPDYIRNLNNLQHFKFALKHICFSVHILYLVSFYHTVLLESRFHFNLICIAYNYFIVLLYTMICLMHLRQ